MNIVSFFSGDLVRILFKFFREHFVASFFLFFGVGLFLYGVRGLLQTSSMLKSATKAQATIVESHYDETAQAISVTYEITRSGGAKKQITVQRPGTSPSREGYTVGKSGQVVFDEVSNDVRFVDGAYKSDIIKLVLAVLFCVIGVVLVVQDNKKLAMNKAASEPTSQIQN